MAPPINVPVDPVSRFWKHVEKGDSCWIWTGAAAARGYGRLFLSGAHTANVKYADTHRFSWEIHNGRIPNGLLVLHRCDNPRCVRPDHLFLGNQTMNMTDAALKRRVHNASKTHCPKGHAYDAANTKYVKLPTGRLGRKCRACRRKQRVSPHAGTPSRADTDAAVR